MKMMLLAGLVASMMMVGFMGTASAITFTDTTTFSANGTTDAGDLVGYGGNSVSKLETIGDYVMWKHQFTFVPAAQLNSISAKLYLSIKDDENDKWYNPLSYEYALGYSESGDWDFGEINSGLFSYNINASNSLADGDFKISIYDVWGDFSILSSRLEITYESAPVPEPGTMVLLGAGLLGLAVYGKRHMKKE